MFMSILMSKWTKTTKGFANPLEPRSFYFFRGPCPFFGPFTAIRATDLRTTVHRTEK